MCIGVRMVLQDHTAATTFALFECQQSSTSSCLENIVNALAAQTGAFEISLCANFSCDRLAVMLGDESQRLLAHFLDRNGVFSKILLQTNKNDRNTSAQSLSFLNPLCEQQVSLELPSPSAAGLIPCA